MESYANEQKYAQVQQLLLNKLHHTAIFCARRTKQGAFPFKLASFLWDGVMFPRCVTVHAFTVWFGMRLPRFGTPCDPNNVRKVYLCLMLLLKRTENKFYSAQFTQNVLAVQQFLSISYSLLVSLAWLARLVKLNGQQFVSNCISTCLWRYFKHLIYSVVEKTYLKHMVKAQCAFNCAFQSVSWACPV